MVKNAKVNAAVMHMIYERSTDRNWAFCHDSTPKPDLTFNLPKFKGLKIAFVSNVNLPKYLDELRLRLLSQTQYILALSETRLENTFTDSPWLQCQ